MYNAFQFIISAAAVFTGNAYRKMLNGESTCFVAGTMIMTVAGLIAIEQIKTGDLVLATSPDTYETTFKKVVETYVRETKNLIHLLIRDGDQTEKLITTDTHPFYVSGKGFIPAAELYVGDELCAARTDGSEKIHRTGIIEKILPEVAVNPVKVYNFQVEDLHTYHVGLIGVWVHNAGKEYGSQSNTVKKLVDQVPNKYKQFFKCAEFARNLVNNLIKKGIDYKIIRVDSTDYIYSDRVGDYIGDGFHYGVQVDGIVYDNLTTSGLELTEWLHDLGLDLGNSDIRWFYTDTIINH